MCRPNTIGTFYEMTEEVIGHYNGKSNVKSASGTKGCPFHPNGVLFNIGCIVLFLYAFIKN